MSDFNAKAGIRQQTLEAKVIRADGTVEDLGVIAYYHKNPVRRFLFRLFNKVGTIKVSED